METLCLIVTGNRRLNTRLFKALAQCFQRLFLVGNRCFSGLRFRDRYIRTLGRVRDWDFLNTELPHFIAKTDSRHPRQSSEVERDASVQISMPDYL